MTPHDPNLPDDRDLDDGGLDLTPRDADASRRRSGVRRYGAVAVLAILVVAIGGVAWAARDAALFYRNADEAVAQRESLGTKRFRLQGVVVGEPEELSGDRSELNEDIDGLGGDPRSRFTITYNDVDIEVVNSGKEPSLFKEGLPVVLEGRWNDEGTAYLSDRILVKHTEDYKEKDTDGTYEEEHPDRADVEAESS